MADWIDPSRFELREPVLFASLTGPLRGLYYPLPYAHEGLCRVALNESKLKRLWCAVYRRDEVERQIGEYGGQILELGDARLGTRLAVDPGKLNDEHLEMLCQAEAMERNRQRRTESWSTR